MPKSKPIIDPVYPLLHGTRTSVDNALQCAMNLEAACQILLDTNAVAAGPAATKLRERMAALRKALFGEDLKLPQRG